MLTPPQDLAEEVLVSTLAQRWELDVASLVYRPVGWGSHHWEATTADGTRWFVTVDEPFSFERLQAALATAAALRDHGYPFAVAPARTLDGEPLACLENRFTVALYPFVEGQSFSWGEFSTPAHRQGVLEMLIALHSAPEEVQKHAKADAFAIPHRAALSSISEITDCGPYALPTAKLLAGNSGVVQRLLNRYDELVAAAGASYTVLTHGEPHPGNTMLTASGDWVFIDWDTTLIAPPERDLWNLDPGDGSVLRTYAKATGFPPRPSMLELYRLRWDIADIAVDVKRFSKPHTGTLDDDKTWELLRSLVESLRAGRFR